MSHLNDFMCEVILPVHSLHFAIKLFRKNNMLNITQLQTSKNAVFWDVTPCGFC
jgi:hypothetical protein